MVDDTAGDWEKIGAEEPWYGVLSAPEYLKANLTEEAKDRFYEQGRAEMDAIVAVLERTGAFKPRIGVDFGCGLGRLTFPMASLCQQVYGIDVSPGMRLEAERQASQRDVAGTLFLNDLPKDARVDWINSYIVFQHILPRTGYILFESLLARLNVGGHISVQVTYAHERSGLADLEVDLSSWRFDGETLTTLRTAERPLGRMSMYDYDLNRIFKLCTTYGIGDYHLRHTDHGGSQGFWICGRKDV